MLHVNLLSAYPAQAESRLVEAAQGLDGNVVAACVPGTSGILREFAFRACALNPGLRISIKENSSLDIWEGLEAGKVTLAIVDSIESSKGRKIILHPFAVNGLLVAVNPRNPLSGISSEQFAKVMDGRISEWPQLGGKSGRINFILPDGMPGAPSSAEGESEDNPFGIRSHPSACTCQECQKAKKGNGFGNVPFERLRNIETTQEMTLGTVSSDLNALTVVDMSHIEDGTVKFLEIDGSAPSVVNIVAAKYPLGKQLYLAVPEDAGELPGSIAKIISGDSFSPKLLSYGCLPLKR